MTSIAFVRWLEHFEKKVAIDHCLQWQWKPLQLQDCCKCNYFKILLFLQMQLI
jgi:hypothetical protein